MAHTAQHQPGRDRGDSPRIRIYYGEDPHRVIGRVGMGGGRAMRHLRAAASWAIFIAALVLVWAIYVNGWSIWWNVLPLFMVALASAGMDPIRTE